MLQGFKGSEESCRECGRRLSGCDSRGFEKRLADFRSMVGDDTAVLCPVCMTRVYEEAKKDILSQITVEQVAKAMAKVYRKKFPKI